MVPLESMEICPFALRSVDVMQGVVGQIIAEVAHHKTAPESEV